MGCDGFRATFGPEMAKLRKSPDKKATLQALNIITVWLEGRRFAPTAELADPKQAVFYEGWSAHVSRSRAGEELQLSHPNVEVVNMLHWLLYCETVHTDECRRRPHGSSCHHTITLPCN
jgi:hypothetical protein